MFQREGCVYSKMDRVFVVAQPMFEIAVSTKCDACMEGEGMNTRAQLFKAS